MGRRESVPGGTFSFSSIFFFADVTILLKSASFALFFKSSPSSPPAADISFLSLTRFQPLASQLTVFKLMANQSKRISQETFDETVKENMDDFDMSREAAIADAIEQFKMQVHPPAQRAYLGRTTRT